MDINFGWRWKDYLEMLKALVVGLLVMIIGIIAAMATVKFILLPFAHWIGLDLNL